MSNKVLNIEIDASLLKEMMREINITQAELGERTDISRRTINTAINRETASYRTIILISDFFGVSPDMLIKKEKKEKK